MNSRTSTPTLGWSGSIQTPIGEAIKSEKSITIKAFSHPRRFTPLFEPPYIIFEKLKVVGILRPIWGNISKNFPPYIDTSKRCSYHSGKPSHTTDECGNLRQDIQILLDNGQINQVVGPHVQFVWYRDPNIVSYTGPKFVPRSFRHQFTTISESYASLFHRLKLLR